MRPRRIYVPLTREELRELAELRRLTAPLQAFAAGAPGRVDARISPAASQEEVEYLAFRAAASHAAALDDGARRVIASADVPDDAIRELPVSASSVTSGPTPVVIAEDLPLRAIASLHIDEAGETDDDTEPDLLWYDITELDAVVAELDR